MANQKQERKTKKKSREDKVEKGKICNTLRASCCDFLLLYQLGMQSQVQAVKESKHTKKKSTMLVQRRCNPVQNTPREEARE